MYIKFFLASLFTMLLFFEALAGVTFITESKSNSVSDRGKSPLNTQTNCPALGYTKTSCPKGQTLVKKCPHSGRYFLDCCPNGYAYRPESCIAAGYKPSKKSCHGLVACE